MERDDNRRGAVHRCVACNISQDSEQHEEQFWELDFVNRRSSPCEFPVYILTTTKHYSTAQKLTLLAFTTLTHTVSKSQDFSLTHSTRYTKKTCKVISIQGADDLTTMGP